MAEEWHVRLRLSPWSKGSPALMELLALSLAILSGVGRWPGVAGQSGQRASGRALWYILRAHPVDHGYQCGKPRHLGPPSERGCGHCPGRLAAEGALRGHSHCLFAADLRWGGDDWVGMRIMEDGHA
jgi:hypothetical protein